MTTTAKQTAADSYQQKLSALRGSWQPEDFSKVLLIPDNRLGVLTDVHIPYYDEALSAQAFDQFSKDGVEAIVIAGDLMDIPLFSHWGVEDHTTLFTRELDILRGFIEIALTVAPYVYWSIGNHEVRLMRKLDNQIYLEQLARMAGLGSQVDEGKLILSDHPTLEAFEGSWMITHPSQYSKIPLDVPSRLAQKYRKNIMCGHSHHWGMGAFEEFTVIETGGLFSPKHTKYMSRSVNTLRQWVQGFWTLIDGEPRGYRKKGN